jgi:hypothetical protein
MKIKEILAETKKPAVPKPRNFVAKNASKTTSGAGVHRDKKKEQKQGYEKHKNKELAEGSDNDSKKLAQIAWKAAKQSLNDVDGEILMRAAKLFAAGRKLTALRVIDRMDDYARDDFYMTLALSGVKLPVDEDRMEKNIKQGSGSRYADQLATKVYDENNGLDTTGEATELIDVAYEIASRDLDRKRARYLFVYDEDFVGDLIAAYSVLQQSKGVSESATAGATSTANIGTVVNPHISPGPARGKKSYLGSPWGGKSGTKAPPQPKVVQPKNPDGTAKSAHDIKSASLFGGPVAKR